MTSHARIGQLCMPEVVNLYAIGRDSVTVLTRDGQRHELGRGDPMLERLDLAYAINVHIAQGMTADKGIVLMSEREKMLNTTQSFLVAVTRIAETATLVVDNVRSLERDVTRNPGGKTSAMDAAAQPNNRPELPVPVLELDLSL